jgi:hypothetical protein
MAIPVDSQLYADLLGYLEWRKITNKDKKAAHFYVHLLATRVEHERNQNTLNLIAQEQTKDE